jgi:site-specific DNA-cytosine methylase
MRTLSRTLLQRLPDDVREELHAMARSQRPLAFSTLCSGTDCPALAIKAFDEALAEDAACAIVAAQQEFACESNVNKRMFLSRMCPQIPLIFKDVAELSGASAQDHLSGKAQCVPRVEGTIGGFPCTDVSRLNGRARTAENTACVSSASLRTGFVFDRICAYVKSRRPEFRWLVLENVQALAQSGPDGGASNLDVCCQRLQEELNFVVLVFFLDARDFGRVHSRRRLYLVCICRAMLGEAKVQEQDVVELMTSAMARFVGHEPINVDSVLLPEGHPDVVSHYRRLQRQEQQRQEEEEEEEEEQQQQLRHSSSLSSSASSLAQQKPGSLKRVSSSPKSRACKWAIKHSRFFEERGLDWTRPSDYRDPAIRHLFPGLLELTDRQIDILEGIPMAIPERASRYVDLSMSMKWAKATRHTGCFSSGSLTWLGHRARFALPREMLHLMGIFYDSEEHLSEFPDSLIRDLCGNAFDSSSFLAVWVALVSVFARIHAAASLRR